MPLPPWDPTDEQRSLLEEAAAMLREADEVRDEAKRRADAIEAEAWARVLRARRAGAPKDGIVAFLPRARPTIYRHLPANDRPRSTG